MLYFIVVLCVSNLYPSFLPSLSPLFLLKRPFSLFALFLTHVNLHLCVHAPNTLTRGKKAYPTEACISVWVYFCLPSNAEFDEGTKQLIHALNAAICLSHNAKLLESMIQTGRIVRELGPR